MHIISLFGRAVVGSNCQLQNSRPIHFPVQFTSLPFPISAPQPGTGKTTLLPHDASLTLSQWSSSGNPVCLELRPQCTRECHWRNASVFPMVFQWSSSGFPVVFQCVPIMQINTGSPLGQHWVLASASVVPVASQCTCGSSGLPVCSNYAN